LALRRSPWLPPMATVPSPELEEFELAIAAFQVWLSALAPLPGPGARSAQAPSA
jgi:hypothetical protein